MGSLRSTSSRGETAQYHQAIEAGGGLQVKQCKPCINGLELINKISLLLRGEYADFVRAVKGGAMMCREFLICIECCYNNACI